MSPCCLIQFHFTIPLSPFHSTIPLYSFHFTIPLTPFHSTIPLSPFHPTQARARDQGLWNLFLPLESDPDRRYGGGLTNLEYAHLAEIMGQSVFASEVSHQQDGVGFVGTRTHTPISVVGQCAQCQVWYSCRISTMHVVSRHQGQSNITRL